MKRKIKAIAPDKFEDYDAYKKDIRRKFNEVLEKNWDPIGVYQITGDDGRKGYDHETPLGEYDSYVQTLIWMVAAKMSRQQIAKMLSFFAEDLICCGLFKSEHLSAADKLISVYYEWPGFE